MGKSLYRKTFVGSCGQTSAGGGRYSHQSSLMSGIDKIVNTTGSYTVGSQVFAHGTVLGGMSLTYSDALVVTNSAMTYDVVINYANVTIGYDITVEYTKL